MPTAQSFTCLNVAAEASILPSIVAIGDNIKAARKRANLAQGQAAQNMKISQGQLSDWENNRYPIIELDNLFMLATEFGCSLDDLLRGSHDEYDKQRRDAARKTTQLQALLRQFEDPELLSQVLDKWPRTTRAGHETASTVLDGFQKPRPVHAPADSSQPSLQSPVTTATDRRTRSRKQGA